MGDVMRRPNKQHNVQEYFVVLTHRGSTWRSPREGRRALSIYPPPMLCISKNIQTTMTKPLFVNLLLFVGGSIALTNGFQSPIASNIQSVQRSYDITLQSAIDENALSSNPPVTRRQINELAFAAIGLTTTFAGTREITPQDYGLWGVLPVGPYKRKKTIMESIVEDTIWTFDQKFGILNVQVPLRMTVIKLKEGGLFVYDAIAATPELLGYMSLLEKEHGPVKHIVLGSVAIEHKVYAGVFAQKFPTAQIWVQPGQYAFPSNLPIQYLGFPAGRTNFSSTRRSPSCHRAKVPDITYSSSAPSCSCVSTPPSVSGSNSAM